MVDVIERFNDYVVKKIIVYLETDVQRGEEAKQKVEYSLKVVLDEVEKLLILIMVFNALGKAKEFVVAIITIASIRSFLGGSHRKTTIGCICFSFAAIYIILAIAEKSNIVLIFEEIIYLLIMLLILTLAPITSNKGINYKYIKKLEFRLKAVSILLILSRVVVYIPEWSAKIILSALLVQGVEAGSVYIMRKMSGGEVKNEIKRKAE